MPPTTIESIANRGDEPSQTRVPMPMAAPPAITPTARNTGSEARARVTQARRAAADAEAQVANENIVAVDVMDAHDAPIDIADPNDVAANAITGAVGSVVARQLWDKRGACASQQVRPKDIAAAEAAIPGSTAARTLRTFRLPEAAAAEIAPARAAKIVSRVSF